MKEDFQKFMDLVRTDETIRKKLEEAARNYDGEQSEEAVFHAVVAPVAGEAGFSLALEDIKDAVQELDMDEMSQVAGGGGYGLSFSECLIIGGGAGVAGGSGEKGTLGGGAVCLGLGFGFGKTKCAGKGRTEFLGTFT